MDMHSRKEYLKRLQQRYFQCQSKKEKTSILNEYCKNTRQNRKYVISRITLFFLQEAKRKERENVSTMVM